MAVTRRPNSKIRKAKLLIQIAIHLSSGAQKVKDCTGGPDPVQTTADQGCVTSVRNLQTCFCQSKMINHELRLFEKIIRRRDSKIVL